MQTANNHTTKPIENVQFLQIYTVPSSICFSSWWFTLAFTFIDVRSCGMCYIHANLRTHCWKQFRKMFWTFLQESHCKIPTTNSSVPYMFSPYEAYGVSRESVMAVWNKTCKKEKLYSCLSWAKQFIKNICRILSNKWQNFHRPLSVSIHSKEFNAYCVLHNFMYETNGHLFYYTLYVEGLFDILILHFHIRSECKLCSGSFSKYLVSSEGKCPAV
jgi:hypothetical protein